MKAEFPTINNNNKKKRIRESKKEKKNPTIKKNPKC
jgi:hypothetical protein